MRFRIRVGVGLMLRYCYSWRSLRFLPFRGASFGTSRDMAARWQALRQGRYLHLLEPYLQGERRAVPSASGFDRFCLLLVDLSGGQLAEGTISAYAPGMRRWGKGRPRAGEVGLLSMPPGPR